MYKAPIHEVIAQMQKYDGHSDAREFMSRFKYDMKNYGLTLEWALRNFDRALEGDALAWLAAKWHEVSRQLDECADND